MRTRYIVQARDESDATLACGLLRARLPFTFNRDDWVGFAVFVNMDDGCEMREFTLLLRAVGATATNGVIAEILP